MVTVVVAVRRWNAADQVTAVAHDNPIPGFNTRNTINLRLWAAKPDKEFDLEAFNTGDYVQAILAKQRAETLSSVLYPDDRTYEGKELRLKQQHFFVSATLQARLPQPACLTCADFALRRPAEAPPRWPQVMGDLHSQHTGGCAVQGTSSRCVVAMSNCCKL